MSDRERIPVIEPHQYTEKAARARLERRRNVGEELFMVYVNGHWYTGHWDETDG